LPIGLYTASLISAVLGTRLPGPGAVYTSPSTAQMQDNRARDFSGISSATVTVTTTVSPILTGARKFKVCEMVLDGEALVKVPSRKAAKESRHRCGYNRQKTADRAGRRCGRARRGLLSSTLIRLPGRVRSMKAIVYVLGALCIVVAIVYFVLPADQLPGFMPGHDAAIANIRLKHGIAAAIVGVVLLAIGRFVGRR
jgi:uncharacterized membrane protein YkvA (DUF1232 family)